METLRLFATVARCHSFSKAAAMHGVTQSAASQRVGQLEKRLGVKLLDRSVRPLALTQAGQVYLDGCEELLERYDRLEQQVSGMQEEVAGYVQVAAIYSVGIELLDRIREQFETAHEHRIMVQITYNQPDEVYREVHEHEADLGILSYPRRWSGVGVIPVRDEVMAVVCRPEHPLAERETVQAAELSPFEMVTFDGDLPVGRRIRHYLREHGAKPRIVNSFDNIDTIKNAVMVTESFAILPRRTVGRELEAGTLAAVELKPTLVRPIGVIHHRRQKHAGPLAPPAQAFVDYLLKHAGEDAKPVGGSQEPGQELVGGRI